MIGQVLGGFALLAAGGAAGAGLGAVSTPACPPNPSLAQAIACDKRLNAGLGAAMGVLAMGAGGLLLAIASPANRVAGLTAAGAATALVVVAEIRKNS